MKYLGIDYGDRNVGIALSDDEGKMAFPKDQLINTSALVDDILNIVHRERVSAVVMGESADLYGKDNPIMKRINAFKENLEEHGIPVYFENEIYSTHEAARPAERTRENKKLPKNDASAATIILQSYLDKMNNK
jgi:putative Holliday junction resolvase